MNSNVSVDYSKPKAHSCLMIVAWMYFASTAILLARYYKYILPYIKIFKAPLWLNLHRALMILVPVISFTAFLIILSDLNWKWIETEEKVEFTHSIFGIITISLSVIQVVLGFLRPSNDKPLRAIFNIAHKLTGISCFILSIVTIYLGLTIEKMNLGDSGWGVMIGWTLWNFILPLGLELLWFALERNKKSEKSNNSNDDEQSSVIHRNKFAERLKSILLLIHLFVSMAFTFTLIVLIATADKPSFKNSRNTS